MRNKAADDCQAHRLFLSSSYWQACRRREFVAQQQKDLTRSIFQQSRASDVGVLVYKHSRRNYYLTTYFLVSIIMAAVLVQATLLVTGYVTPDTLFGEYTEFDERDSYNFLSIAVVFGTLLYLLTHSLMSRTIIYIYYNEQTRRFLGICYNWRMARKNIDFKPGEVQLVGSPKNVVQVFRGGYVINKQRYHISTRDFTSPRHYNVMLGFIRP